MINNNEINYIIMLEALDGDPESKMEIGRNKNSYGNFGKSKQGVEKRSKSTQKKAKDG